MTQAGRAHKGKVCNMCGHEGFPERLITCSQCKQATEHSYCTANHPTAVSKAWICEACKDENMWLVQLPSVCVPFKIQSADVSATPCFPSKKSECARSSSRCDLHVPSVHMNNQSSASLDRTLACCREEMIESSLFTKVYSSPLKAIKGVEWKSNDQLYPPYDDGKNSGICTDIQFMGSDRQGIGLSPLMMLPKRNEIQWRGQFVINATGYDIYDINAHFPGHMSMKAYNASKLMPERLQFRLVHRLEVWPQSFQLVPPSFDDAALYFLPIEVERSKEKYIHLLEQMNKHDLAMCCCLNDLELLVYTSKLLSLDPQNLNTSLYLWGIFHYHRRNKPNQVTRGAGERKHSEADNEPVAEPVVTHMGQSNGCGPVSDQNGFHIHKFPTALLKLGNNNTEQDVPNVPPAFSKLSMGDSGCGKRPSVKFELQKRSHISSDISPGFSRPLHLKHASGLTECIGKSSIPKTCETGGLSSFASGRGCVIGSSNTEKIHYKPRGRAYAAAVKPVEIKEQVYLDEENDAEEELMEDVEYEEIEKAAAKPVETEEQVHLGENNDAELMEECVEYEDIEVEAKVEVEEVKDVEKEGKCTIYIARNPETTIGGDDEMKDGENEGDESEKHAELLALPPHGSEVCISNIPRDVSEDDLKSFVESIGEITEVRLMKGKDSAENKGYAFVTYRTEKLASKAIEDLKNKEFKGKKVKVSISHSKHQLFIGKVPKNWDHDDLKKVVMKIGPGVTLVDLIKDHKSSSHNRGFAFIEYYNHACADYSRKMMSTSQFKLGSNTPFVSWAKSSNSQVKELRIKNLPKNVTRDQVKKLFNHHGEITKIILPPVKSGQETRFGFVYFAERSSAVKALSNTEKYELDGQVLECSLTYPPADGKNGNSWSNSQKAAPADRKKGNSGSNSQKAAPADSKKGNSGSNSQKAAPADSKKGNSGPNSQKAAPANSRKVNSGSNSQKAAPADRKKGNSVKFTKGCSVPGFPPPVGFRLVRPYVSIPTAHVVAGFGQAALQPVMYGRRAAPPGTGMMPVSRFLPNQPFQYVRQQIPTMHAQWLRGGCSWRGDRNGRYRPY